MTEQTQPKEKSLAWKTCSKSRITVIYGLGKSSPTWATATNLALLLLVNHLTGSTAALATMAILLSMSGCWNKPCHEFSSRRTR